MNTRAVQRRYDLDWLRVLAILTIFVFHSGRFFDTGGWHVKNPTTYLGVTIWTSLLAAWIMPLVFVISGASIFYALGKGGAGKFIKDKVLRLLVPLVVGAFTHASLAVYFERLTYGQFRGSFFEFLPHYFDGFLGFGGNFAWMGMHLWYLEVLFVYSLAFLPLFVWLKRGSGKRLLGWLGGFLARPGAVYLLALPGTLLVIVLNPNSLFFGNRDWGNWALPMYIFYFLAGFVVVSHEGLQARIRRQRWFSLAATAALLIALLSAYILGGEPVFGTLRYALTFSLYSLLSWGCVLAILGFGTQYLTFSTPFLRYANEAVLPFYVMHQTVLLSVGYFVVRWAIPDVVKFAIIAVTSFAIIMSLYEFLVRRINVLRFLFGMKVRPKASSAQSTEAAPSSRAGMLPSA